MRRTSPSHTTITRRTFLAAIPIGAALVAVGCTSAQDVDSPLTPAQAERFATMRFGLHEQGAFRASVLVAAEVAMDAEVQVDLAAALGYGTFESFISDSESQSGILAWSAERLAVASPGTLSDAEDAEWYARPVETSAISDLFLLMLLSLGTDRPENPQLLQQSTARFQGTEHVDGVRCEIFSGPQEAGNDAKSRTRYWVSEDGEMKRFEAHLDTQQDTWSRADILPPDETYAIAEVAQGLLSVGVN